MINENMFTSYKYIEFHRIFMLHMSENKAQ